MNGPRNRHLGELGVDLAIVAGSALYVHAAGHYPPQGRQIPVLVGWIAIGLGVLHLVAHAVPRLWAVTHDSQARTKKPAAAARTAAAPAPAPGDTAAAPPVALETPPGDPRQVVLAMAWVVLLLVAVYFLGFDVAIPAFFLVYFAVMKAWWTAVISAVAMWAVTYGLFEYALGVPLPHGWL